MIQCIRLQPKLRGKKVKNLPEGFSVDGSMWSSLPGWQGLGHWPGSFRRGEAMGQKPAGELNAAT